GRLFVVIAGIVSPLRLRFVPWCELGEDEVLALGDKNGFGICLWGDNGLQGCGNFWSDLKSGCLGKRFGVSG
ncbi:MAG: hypothetical protein ACRYGG_08605, partial [Janthinobacterium lividum]